MITIMSDWRSLFTNVPKRNLVPGEAVFRREDPIRSVFLVCDGAIALERPLPDGTSLTLHLARSGMLLAEASVFASAYHCDAVAREASCIVGIPRERFRDALVSFPSAAGELLAETARELQALRSRVEILRLRRLADRLDAWRELHDEPPAGHWVHVADAIGVTPAALYRELARRRRP